ncbi:hypothetical protein GQ43DRAFT_401362 [Delitschia confertaspora ATCC 74209]|uniref:Uncharacterized protein n=1 Tax=Delitschia confertaspora ATCC 74209 TaxID=1513339 RepID=A0A9P4JF30_9PLEO|nr:hypothetical protein GQ43DRAFT_401362 [Delitschia confertaspora ATCC 74209]
MVTTLPDDILHLLCEELALRQDFHTLFQCACASRALAVPALTYLYRTQHYSPIRGGTDDESLPRAVRELIVQKWSILWRSIIASSLDATLFPYCRYLKMLDFRDLENLLEDDQFRGKIPKHFFSEPLMIFHKTIDHPLRRSGRRKVERLNVPAIIDAIGEVITQHTPTLESISGKLLSHALVRWAPRVPRLQALELKDGSPLEDDLVHSSIHAHCPQFNSLSIYTWAADNRDHRLSEFINGMRPQSLRFFQTIRDVGASQETFLALENHCESLKDLRLCLSNEALEQLSSLQTCTALETLRIEDTSGRVDLEKTQNDVFLEVITWLRNCKTLRNLTMTKFLSAAAVTMPLLLETNIKLRRLEVDSYVVKDHQLFHQALAHQASSLEILSLSGDTDEMVRDDVDILVDVLKSLIELRELKLLLPEVLRDEHYVWILDSLLHLEELYITGLLLSDIVLVSLAKLTNLRSVTFNGLSTFTKEGLSQWVSKLGPGNRGIRIMIDMADPYSLLSDEQVALVRSELEAKVDGSLEYTPFRDPDMSEFEGESD